MHNVYSDDLLLTDEGEIGDVVEVEDVDELNNDDINFDSDEEEEEDDEE